VPWAATNARLIAAAPELVDARGVARTRRVSGARTGEAARMLLAKARGERSG